MPHHKHRHKKRRTKRISFAGLVAAAVGMALVSAFVGVIASQHEIPIVWAVLMAVVLWLAGMFAVWAIATNRRAYRVSSELNPSVIRPATDANEQPGLPKP